MDLELDLGPFKICGKDRTEGPFLAEDRWPDLGPKKLDTLTCLGKFIKKMIVLKTGDKFRIFSIYVTYIVFIRLWNF